MSIQKYPYNITKIDWYDYISRGECKILFQFRIDFPNIGAYNFDKRNLISLVAFDEKIEKAYSLRVCQVIMHTHGDIDSITNGEAFAYVRFYIPETIPPGKYFVQLKNMLNDKEGCQLTIPTEKCELSFVILDTEKFIPPVTDNNHICKNVADFKWKEKMEESHENN